jgi:hypothetical protein
VHDVFKYLELTKTCIPTIDCLIGYRLALSKAALDATCDDLRNDDDGEYRGDQMSGSEDIDLSRFASRTASTSDDGSRETFVAGDVVKYEHQVNLK